MKWTIFKKTFLILLGSMILVNILNIRLDYLFQHKNLQNEVLTHLTLYDEKIQSLSKTYNKEHWTLNNKVLQEEINQITAPASLLDSGILHYNTVLLDKNFQAIDTKKKKSAANIKLFGIKDGNKELSAGIPEVIDDQESIAKVVTIIKENPHEPIYCRFHPKKSDNGVDYLTIEDQLIIGDIEPDENIYEGYLLFFENEDVFISYYNSDIDFYGIDENYFMDYNLVEDNIIHEINTNGERIVEYGQNAQENFVDKYCDTFRLGEDIYTYELIPLLNSQIELDDDYDVTDYDLQYCDGYILYYLCIGDAYSILFNEVVMQKMIVYFISLVVIFGVCLALSYILSKRIKNMSQAMQYITNQEFDYRLDENSKDELGTLAHNINIMSQTLKDTIYHLNDEIDRVKKLEEVKQEFLANFTHEIKTPLAIISGYIELINDTTDDNKKRNYLTSIETSVERIDELVKAMLNLSKLESGNVKLELDQIDLDELMTTVIDSMISLIQKKNLQVQVVGDNTIIQADPFQFQIAIENFLSNAIKHTPENGSIYITYNNFMISIENEGSYLTDELMERIWDTYVSSDHEGTGLGLAICRSILDLHGFRYLVENTKRGVCFTIQINSEDH